MLCAGNTAVEQGVFAAALAIALFVFTRFVCAPTSGVGGGGAGSASAPPKVLIW